MESVPTYRVGLVQMAMAADPAGNLARALAKTEEAAARGAEVVCLPELFRSQYFCQREDAAFFDLAEPIPGPTTEAVGEVARQRGVVVIAPVFERRAGMGVPPQVSCTRRHYEETPRRMQVESGAPSAYTGRFRAGGPGTRRGVSCAYRRTT